MNSVGESAGFGVWQHGIRALHKRELVINRKTEHIIEDLTYEYCLLLFDVVAVRDMLCAS
jgi:hypothetical protein